MDPITLAIAAAIGAGIAKGAEAVGENLLLDAYNGLKSLLKRKFGGDSGVVKAVEDLEAHPDSAGRKSVLEEEVAQTKATDDPELQKAAQAVLDQVRALPDGGQHIQSVIGNYNAQADRGSTATVNVNQPPKAGQS